MVGLSSPATRQQEVLLSRAVARRRVLFWSLVKHVVLISISVLFLLPWAWMLSTSLKPAHQLFVLPPVWIPHPVAWSNYPAVFQKYPFFLYGANTLTIALSTVAGALLSNTLIAYSLGRLRWWGRDVAF